MRTLVCVAFITMLSTLGGVNPYEISEEEGSPVLFYVGEPLIDADVVASPFNDENPTDMGDILLIKRALVGLSGARGFGKRRDLYGFNGLSGARGFGKRDLRSHLSSHGARGFGKRSFNLARTNARGFGR